MTENTFNFLFLTLGTIVLAAIIVLALRGEKKRQGLLSAEALKTGGRFEARPDTAFVAELSKTFFVFRLFRKKAVTNLIEWSDTDAMFRLFDYAYMRPGSRSPSFWSVLLVTSPRLQLPAFKMGEQGKALRFRDQFKSKPIEFPVQEFSDAHQVHADDGVPVASIFSERLQRFLADLPGYCMEGAGTHFVLYVPDLKLKPQLIRTPIDDGSVILKELVGDRLRPNIAPVVPS